MTSDFSLFGRGSEAEKLIRQTDWSKTAVGLPSGWPLSLRSPVSICLNSNFPIAIYWGENLELIYNDAWSDIPGAKHPWAFGKPARDVWPEIWNDIEPQFIKAFQGIPGGSKDGLLPMQRHGYTEECYFDFTFTPIYDEHGKVAGVFNAVLETSFRLISQRRTALLQRIGLSLAELREPMDIWNSIVDILSHEQYDVSFACFYVHEGNKLELKAATRNIEANVYEMKWPFPHPDQPAASILIDTLQDFITPVPMGYWPEVPVEAVCLPITGGSGVLIGWCVLGLNARRRYDGEYRTFCESLTHLISSALATADSFKREREKAQALAEIDKAKTAFFNNVSHELRTPLTLILGPLEEELQRTTLPDSTIRNINLAYRNTERLYKLVNQLLEFSRLEAGRITATFKAADINALTEETARLFEPVMRKAGLRFSVELETVARPVYLDYDYWEKIVLNLLSNAFKFTLVGGITLRQFAMGPNVVLQVTDTGVGIPKEETGKVFDRFHRVASTVGRSFEGTGIGLSLVREMVKAHGGDISVASELSRGTTFTVTIPFGKESAAPGNDTAPAADKRSLASAFLNEADSMLLNGAGGKTEFAAQRPTILITDDNQDLRAYIASLLSNEFNIVEAGTGNQALERVAQGTAVDLIISDVMMPVMDGKELVRRLKADPKTKAIPVILLSARAGEEAKVDGLQTGADDYLIKPFSAKELIARVRALLRTASIRKQSVDLILNLFEQAPISLSVFQGPDFVIEEMNAMALTDIGRERHEVLGKPLMRAVPETEGQDVMSILKTVYESGKKHIAIEHPVTFVHEGERREQFFNFVYLPVNEGSHVTRIMAMATDVTESVKSRRALEESERHFKLIAEASPVLIWIAGLDKMCTYFNVRWLEYTGKSMDHELGYGWAEGVHPDDRARCIDLYHDAFNAREKVYMEYRLRRHDGEYRWISDNGVPRFDANGVFQGYIGGCVDIHERVTASEVLEQKVALRTEELNKKNQELEQFAYISSHDLQEPLRKIRAFSDRARSFVDKNDTVLNYLDRVDAAASRMSTLIKDILAYSRLDTNEQYTERVDMNKVLHQVQGDLELLIEDKRAVIQSDHLPTITGNGAQLFQLVFNLVSNALKFSEKQPEVTITCQKVGAEQLPVKRSNTSDQYFKIVFSDNGIGFDQQHADKIFGLFQRLHGRETHAGTGIGLALCRKVVENHGGAIIAYGQPGSGATFTVFLPVPELSFQYNTGEHA